MPLFERTQSTRLNPYLKAPLHFLKAERVVRIVRRKAIAP